MKPFVRLGVEQVSTYTICLVIAFLVALALTAHAAWRRLGVRRWKLGVVLAATVVATIPGARLLSLLAEPHARAALGSAAELLLPRAGMAFFGGLLAGTLAAGLSCALLRVPFRAFADAAIPATLVGLSFGRIGCFLRGCCWGSPTASPLALVYSDFDAPARPIGVPLHPTQLYEALLCALIAVACFRLSLQPWFRRRPGSIAAFGLVCYGLRRTALETLRADPRGDWWSLSTSQWLGVVVTAAALLLPRWRPADRPADGPIARS
jgi:phosphatidylglycerol:prolipoprotein diacylglycerol transferase